MPLTRNRFRRFSLAQVPKPLNIPLQHHRNIQNKTWPRREMATRPAYINIPCSQTRREKCRSGTTRGTAFSLARLMLRTDAGVTRCQASGEPVPWRAPWALDDGVHACFYLGTRESPQLQFGCRLGPRPAYHPDIA
jgi:hypothetical protein